MKTLGFRGLKRNNKGQMALEAVLLMVVLMGFFMYTTKEVRERQLIAKLVEPSINTVKNMTAYGTWKGEDQGCTAPGKTKQTIGKCHPNSIARSLSSDPSP